MTDDQDWPWCNCCQSYHHPDNPTCRGKPPLSPHTDGATEREKLLAAVIDVYAFTLEFVIQAHKHGFADLTESQIEAARDAYNEAFGEPPPFPPRRRDEDE
jgi:hypothetical protein